MAAAALIVQAVSAIGSDAAQMRRTIDAQAASFEPAQGVDA